MSQARKWDTVLLRPLALLLVTACAAAPPSTAPAADAAAADTMASFVRLGAAADARPALRGPSLLLQGSGRPLAEAFAAHLAQVADGPADVVVLSASPPAGASATPECDVIRTLPAAASCETITLRSAAAAALPRVAATIDRAEVVYFAGGNQCNYVAWKGTPLHAAVARLHARGGGVGGGSAGLAIQGEIVYDGCTGSATSAQALADPHHPSISFTTGFLDWPVLRGVLTDSHFVERDRMGRLLAFLARNLDERGAPELVGLGVDGRAAFVVDRDGVASAFGGPSFVVRAERGRGRVAAGEPLSHEAFRVARIEAGARYRLAERAAAGRPLGVHGGTLDADPYAPR